MYINKKIFKPKRFSSGELKLIKDDLNSYIENNNVEILHDGTVSIFELMLIINYYVKNGTVVDLILSYLPYQRMDHPNSAELATIQHVANLFNNLGLNSITICEPHCNVEIFNNSKPFSLVNAIKQSVFDEISFNPENDTVILTDKGGYNRYNNLCKNLAYFNKIRDPQTGLIKSHEIVGKYMPKGKAIIVDDIISSGDTIMSIIQMLKELNQTNIYVLSGHFEKNKYNKRILHSPYIKKVFSTNSLSKRQNKKLKLYDIKEIFYGKN